MKRTDLDDIKKQGLKALRSLADASDEIELLRHIADLSYEDNRVYVENRHLLRSSDTDAWKKKQRLIKALQKYRSLN